MRNWDPAFLEQLLKVQEIDLKIRGLEKEIEEIYRKSKEEDPRIAAEKKTLREVEESIEAAEAQRRMYIETVEDIRTAIKGISTTKTGSPKPRTRSSTDALRSEEDKLCAMILETENQIKALNADRRKLGDHIAVLAKSTRQIL